MAYTPDYCRRESGVALGREGAYLYLTQVIDIYIGSMGIPT